jgi:hypothetical protein
MFESLRYSIWSLKDLRAEYLDLRRNGPKTGEKGCAQKLKTMKIIEDIISEKEKKENPPK